MAAEGGGLGATPRGLTQNVDACVAIAFHLEFATYIHPSTASPRPATLNLYSMAGRVAPVPPFVELPSLPRPQVVDEGGFELSDEQIEALAAQVAGDGADEEEGAEEVEEEVEGSAQVSVAEGEEPEERQPLLSLDQR
jgi:hypothetical protein